MLNKVEVSMHQHRHVCIPEHMMNDVLNEPFLCWGVSTWQIAVAKQDVLTLPGHLEGHASAIMPSLQCCIFTTYEGDRTTIVSKQGGFYEDAHS
eukprot:CAMPEP_0202920788 /NCGR_PEP_ID=MMETSP1392-20130828/77040_1 /ASSEMBLY_ACC=CAM_ASM_000868 /TAXON_ID=225041 /ORGANISM="Chlamydomonas chlamydogama, Strain SAG 11-48b" /LENGTH=93 /DNA_ID=CAMNT_0049614301 /DNA_START=4319 /DNA_END=4600 /DNA_ORIENTATION=-